MASTCYEICKAAVFNVSKLSKLVGGCLNFLIRQIESIFISEPVHEISNNVVCATSKASDQPAHTRSLIRAFTSRLSIL